MTAVEDQLREALWHYAHQPRPAGDMAGSAIRRARRAQRQRLAATAAVALVVIVVVSGLTISHRSSAAPVPPATRPTTPGTADTGDPRSAARFGIRLDALDIGNIVRTVDGHEYELGPDTVTRITRVPAGWLYGHGWLATDQVLLRPDGTSLTLTGVRANEGTVEQPGTPVLSADGQHLAWVLGSTLHAGTLTATGVVDVVASPVPPDSFAATWIGTRVVVGQSYGAAGCCLNRSARYDVWDPSRGNFVPHWTEGLLAVYGPVPTGRPAFGMVAGATQRAGCLASVEGVASMAVTATICLPDLERGVAVLLSPDGRRLVEVGNRADVEMLMVVDLTEVARTRQVLGELPGSEAVIWEDNNTFLARAPLADSKRPVIRCAIDDSGVHTAGGLLDVDGLNNRMGTSYRLIPRLGI